MSEVDGASEAVTSMNGSSNTGQEPNRPGEAGDVASALQGLVDIQDHDDIERDVSEQVKAAAVEEENKKDEGRILNLRTKIQKIEDQKASLIAQKDQKEKARAPRSLVNALQTKIESCANSIADHLDEISAFEERIEERNKQQAAAVAAAAAKPQQPHDGEIQNAGPKQQEGEDRQAFLIRTGKITPFAGLGDVDDSEDDRSTQPNVAAAGEIEGQQVQTSHQVLRQPGFATTRVREPIEDNSTTDPISSNLESEFGLRPRKRRRTSGAEGGVEAEEDGAGPSPTRRKRRARGSGDDDDDDFLDDVAGSEGSDEGESEGLGCAEEKEKTGINLSIIDDANVSVYNARLSTWVRERRELRESLGEVDENPEEEEWHKPTPGKPNKFLLDGYYLPEEVYDFLFPFQKVGIKWLAQLHRRREGGILCDEMGLGKTGK